MTRNSPQSKKRSAKPAAITAAVASQKATKTKTTTITLTVSEEFAAIMKGVAAAHDRTLERHLIDELIPSLESSLHDYLLAMIPETQGRRFGFAREVQS